MNQNSNIYESKHDPRSLPGIDDGDGYPNDNRHKPSAMNPNFISTVDSAKHSVSNEQTILSPLITQSNSPIYTYQSSVSSSGNSNQSDPTLVKHPTAPPASSMFFPNHSSGASLASSNGSSRLPSALPLIGAITSETMPDYEEVIELGLLEQSKSQQNVFYQSLPPEQQNVGRATVTFSTGCLAGFRRGLDTEPHHLAAFITIALAVVFGIWMSEAFGTEYSDNASICFVLFFVVYFIYLIETCCSATSAFIFHDMDLSNATEYVHSVRQERPKITEHVECYHYETRVEYITEKDKDGHINTRVREERVKVVTHTDTEEFFYSSWYDDTVVPPLDEFQLVRLNCKLEWNKNDVKTNHDYDLFIRNFRMKHTYCDQQHDYSSNCTVNGFSSALLVCNMHKQDIPFCLRHGKSLYIIVTIFGGSWFYRVWLAGISESKDILFSKRVSTN